MGLLRITRRFFMRYEAACRVCGCTEELDCEDGCWWVEDPEGVGELCSACAPATVWPGPTSSSDPTPLRLRARDGLRGDHLHGPRRA